MTNRILLHFHTANIACLTYYLPKGMEMPFRKWSYMYFYLKNNNFGKTNVHNTPCKSLTISHEPDTCVGQVRPAGHMHPTMLFYVAREHLVNFQN